MADSNPDISIGQDTKLLPNPPLRLPPTEYRHNALEEPLRTGFWQIDVLTPVLKGQFAVFSGPPNTGKLAVARAAIENFLAENSMN